MDLVPEKPQQPRKLVWLVDSLVRMARFPPVVRQKLGFGLYQVQIGQKHESAKMLHGFAEQPGRCAQTIEAGRIVRCTWRNSEKRFICFMPFRRRQPPE